MTDQNTFDELIVFRDVLESFPFGVIVLDATGNVLMLNRKQESNSRIKREKVIGFKFHDKWQRLFVNKTFSDNYWNLLNKKRPFRFILQSILPQFYDEVVSGLLYGVPFSSGDGYLILCELFTEDSSHEKSLERIADELEESSAYLENLLDSSPNAVIQTDTTGIIHYLNTTGSKIFGYKTEEILGLSISHLLCDPSIMDLIHLHEDMASGIEVECKKRTGNKFPARMQFRDIEKETGKVQAWLFIFRDISTQKKMEVSLNDLLQFEMFISKLSASFIHMAPDEFDRQITDSLQKIGEFFGIDRCFFVIVDDKTRDLEITHNWIGPEAETKAEVNPEIFPWIRDQIQKGNIIKFNRIDDMPDDVIVDRENAIREKVKSYLSIPLKVGSTVKGSLSLNSVKKEFHWPEELIKRLILIGEIFSNCLTQRYSDLQLRAAFSEIEQLKNQMETDYTYLREEIKSEKGFHEIVGESAPLKQVIIKINQVASTDTTVIIFGETGTGKELVARAVHEMSQRKDRPLVKVNCAALSPNLIESELFGHEKGAFTGAHARRLGRFEIANGTTLFLDEIGELPLELQAKLLGVLQDGQFERMGSTTPLSVNTRLIAATNRNLENEVRKGGFRQDLLFRLNVFPITVPSLRNRKDDIPLLVNRFVARYSTKMRKSIKNIPKRVISDLQQHNWPGNIRELENTIERAVVNTMGPTLVLMDNFDSMLSSDPAEQKQIKKLSEVERDHIIKALKSTKWRISGGKGAAVILGLHPNTLRYRMGRLNIGRDA
ncbi:MAG: sigma 54-interacting transcriptional regulator [SAR324 cluster bacterium]|nr:sigma 54-interacting transcriptional regulator [SAR324 cluster bacterium]